MGKIEPANWMVNKEVQTERDIEQRRTHCTVCGVRYDWFRLEPGTGRCTSCQP